MTDTNWFASDCSSVYVLSPRSSSDSLLFLRADDFVEGTLEYGYNVSDTGVRNSSITLFSSEPQDILSNSTKDTLMCDELKNDKTDNVFMTKDEELIEKKSFIIADILNLQANLSKCIQHFEKIRIECHDQFNENQLLKTYLDNLRTMAE